MDNPMITINIEIYEHWGKEKWAQAKLLVLGIDDVLWTNNIDEVLKYIKYDLEKLLSVGIL